MDKNDNVPMNGDVKRDEKQENCCSKRCCLNFLKRNALLIFLIFGIAIGIALGAGLKYSGKTFTDRELMYFRFPGDLLMRMLKMLILPLIVCSLVSGLANLDSRASGRMGGFAIMYYFTTTFIAVILGIILVSAIKPGVDRTVDSTGSVERIAETADTFLDLIRNMFPENVIEACFKQTRTNLKEKTDINGTIIKKGNETEYNIIIETVSGMNVLGLVVYSVALGIVISRMGSKGKILANVFDTFAEATMKMVAIVIWYSPVGIAFLIASEILKMADPVKTLQQLGLYMATVLTGLAIHGLIILPLIYFIIVRKNPFTFVQGLVQALLTAFGTSSSSATLPVTYQCLEENNNIDRRVSRFVLPVGATINMDGTALYEAVAAIFIAQLNGIALDVGQLVTISITATAASIGAAGVPQAGLVTMMIVLTAVDLPASDAAKILAIDWFLDRFRTTVNVLGDSFGAGIVERLSKNHLMKLDDEDNRKQEDVNGIDNSAFSSVDTQL